MKPFAVRDVATPMNQRKRSATKHVHSIYRYLAIKNFARAASRLRARWATRVLIACSSSASTREKLSRFSAVGLGTAIASEARLFGGAGFRGVAHEVDC